jgi:hypothetical protein
MPTLTPQDFVAKWKRVTSRERQATQEHFIDLCRLVGHETPNEFDPTGTQLREAESGFRYTPTSTFETFPFPWPPGHEPADDPRVQAIAQAARELVEMRDRWLSAAPLRRWRAAYGWPGTLTDEEILERLLALNLERAGQQ